MTSQLLTAEQLSERWQVPKSHVYRLARDGKIPTVELGRYRRRRLDAIEAFELGLAWAPRPKHGQTAFGEAA
jgi:excisionase family DNA binding protein